MRLPLSILGMFTFFSVIAQSAIEFQNVDHDFGEIEEKNGYAEHTFNFTNKGNDPIKITNVKASCGCTTPGWTREKVMPGDSGFVTARYNPRNRPGRFRKSLRITTSDPASDQTVYIMGFVKPKPTTPEREYPIVVGDFRLKYKALNMGKISTEKEFSKSFDIYNQSDSIAFINPEKWTIPKHITVTLSPEFINSGESGKLIITYDPLKKNDYGFVSDHIVLNRAAGKSLSVIAVIEEYFPVMTAEELDGAPKLNISNRAFDFGKVKSGTIIETSFELSNSGEEKLKLRAIKSNCECVTYDFKDKTIKKGKSKTLRIKFDTSEMRANQYKSVVIYSNDPLNPTQIITIKGKVEK
ncbi:MAG: DUF1573 domain-containing protein [Bacteroidota bacterium]